MQSDKWQRNRMNDRVSEKFIERENKGKKMN